MLDLDTFIERAAIIEFDGGMSRFQAETLAAEAQGLTRWQAMQEVKRADGFGNSIGSRDNRSARERDNANNMPRVQPASAQQDRAVPERDVHTGSGALALPPLPVERRAKL